MTNLNPTDNSERRRYRMLLIALVTLAALSSAVKDLNKLQQFAGTLHELAADWSNSSIFTASAAAVSPAEKACLDTINQNSDQFHWNGKVASGKVVEIRGLNGDIQAEGTSGDQVEVVANKHARRSDVNTVMIKVVEHPEGVTICAIYPSRDPMTCEPGGVRRSGESGNVEVKENDVRVDFKLKIPAGVNFAGHTVNGEIAAENLAGNVDTKTVNGNITISTSGYAAAKTVNGEISARLGNANWPGKLEFKTINGAISLELPAQTSTSVEAATMNGAISSDFPLTVLGRFSKRQVSGSIGSSDGSGRELLLKTLNGSINLRRAG